MKTSSRREAATRLFVSRIFAPANKLEQWYCRVAIVVVVIVFCVVAAVFVVAVVVVGCCWWW